MHTVEGRAEADSALSPLALTGWSPAPGPWCPRRPSATFADLPKYRQPWWRLVPRCCEGTASRRRLRTACSVSVASFRVASPSVLTPKCIARDFLVGHAAPRSE